MAQQADTFNDFSSALRMRSVIAKFVREEMNRQRPPARHGKVVSYNRFTTTARVLFPGDTETTTVKFPLYLEPTRSVEIDGDALANVARVEGVPGNLWITAITNGPSQSDSSRLYLPKLMGGDFMHQQQASYFSIGTSDLPANDGVWYIGRFVNDTSFASDGLATLDIVIQQSLFCAIMKRYSVCIRANDTSDAWQKVAPSRDSGPWSSNDFELEMKTSSNSVEFRVRRTGWNSGGFTPSGYDFSIWFYGQDWQQDYSVAEAITTDTAPTRMTGTASTEGKGPFLSPALHLPTLNQALITGGGAVNYSTAIAPGILKWTSRFIVMGSGRNQYAQSGFFDIPVPVGSVNIPVYGKSGTTQTNTVAGGIWLDNWDALYYELPYGDVSTGLEANFRIVNYSDTAARFQVPSHWILLAVKNGDSGTVKIANGQVIDSPHNMSFGSGWAALGLGWATPAYRKIQGGMIRLEGVAKTTTSVTTTTNNVIATLPANYRPGVSYMFLVKTDTGTGRIDVNSSGQILVQQSHASGAWVSLDGISFPVEQ